MGRTLDRDHKSDAGNFLNFRVVREEDHCFKKHLRTVVETTTGETSRDFEVVTISGTDTGLDGEKGVVAANFMAQNRALPYAGVVVTEEELGELLRRAPRMTSRWLMYRYEFGPRLTVLPYLGCERQSPAPFINCARGPSPKETLLARDAAETRDSPVASPEKRERELDSAAPINCGASSSSNAATSCSATEQPSQYFARTRQQKWRSWGSQHIGARVRRTLFAEDGETVSGFVDGTVLAWLDAQRVSVSYTTDSTLSIEYSKSKVWSFVMRVCGCQETDVYE